MKMVFKFILLCATLLVSTSNVLAFDEKQNEQITKIINAFKVQDKALISTLITFPLSRQTPVPAINNQQELVNRFDEVFDQNLINLIANSDVEMTGKLWAGAALCFLMVSCG
ncbi:hypothetical protein RT723_00350 [Psychrosphaera aquimarina]|uniref:Uncharacterized protein n=1 Tax=Psychrosphaera aquimarina TaxID=2044854 RepID=A0ABU3QVR1_9GAMM|nr:hypothetical protein [Psychrosphaera aquimarina]MDU0111490.1 hypothetical protein [Psychrosphaera aquimarina]